MAVLSAYVWLTIQLHAASLSTDHRPIHKPVVIDYDPATKKVTVVHV